MERYKIYNTGSLWIERTKSTAGAEWSIIAGRTRTYIPESVRAESMRRRLNSHFDNVRECRSGDFVYFDFGIVIKDADAMNDALLSKLY